MPPVTQEYDPQELLREVEHKMSSSIAALKTNISGLRTGRATVALLEPVRVEAYGDFLPLSQVATVTAPETSMLVVSVWDREVVKNVERAIAKADLGLNPITEGQVLRVPIPAINGERRKELAKKAREYLEGSMIALRNVRRDGMDRLKKAEQDKRLSEDEAKTYSEKVEHIMKKYSKEASDVVEAKVAEITSL